MRTTTRHAALAVCAALALTGCAAQVDDDAPADPTPSAPSSSPVDPDPTTAAPGTRTDVAADVLLGADAWAPGSEPRTETDGVAAWRLPESCAAGTPDTAVAMLTAEHGDGREEASVGVQQVAVLPDADAAVAEADRLVAALGACGADGSSAPTRYVVEPLDVGAQGTGLANDYYGTSAEGDLDGAIGSYLALTRRGTAVTLVSAEGGESTVGAARERVTALADDAWALLCPYEESGC